ncbi:hypothetical protein ABZ603_35815 [Streptomyces anulatus]
MNTMSVDATSVRPTATVADAREEARTFLEALPERRSSPPERPTP